MAINRKTRTIGSSTRPVTAHGAASHNFERVYYKSACTAGDVRGKYEDLDFSTTGSGETLRLRGIVLGPMVPPVAQSTPFTPRVVWRVKVPFPVR